MFQSLHKLRILDFTRILAGPYATACLADLGADVIRILSGSKPDLSSFISPHLPNTKISSVYAYLGRNKRCMTLNLKNKKAIEIIYQLISEYNIIIEQFRPGVMDKLGLGYEDLKKINPSIIYCSISGYGQTGPMKNKAGHDINYLSRSGASPYISNKENEVLFSKTPISDFSSSLYSIIAILSSVIHRFNTGEGQYIDISITDSSIALNSFTLTKYLTDPNIKTKLLLGETLYDYYKTKDDKYMSVGCIEQKFFANFCNVIGKPELISGGISPPNVIEIKEQIRNIFKSKTKDEWIKIFKNIDACVEPVLSLEEVIENEKINNREMIINIPISKDNSSTIKQIALPIKFSKSKVKYNFIGVEAGKHNKEILEYLGYTIEQINEFKENGLFK